MLRSVCSDTPLSRVLVVMTLPTVRAGRLNRAPVGPFARTGIRMRCERGTFQLRA